MHRRLTTLRSTLALLALCVGLSGCPAPPAPSFTLATVAVTDSSGQAARSSLEVELSNLPASLEVSALSLQATSGAEGEVLTFSFAYQNGGAAALLRVGCTGPGGSFGLESQSVPAESSGTLTFPAISVPLAEVERVEVRYLGAP